MRKLVRTGTDFKRYRSVAGLVALATAVLLVGNAKPASAQIVFQAVAGGGNAEAVGDTAQFALSAGTLTLLVSNKFQNPADNGGEITGVTFNVSGATGSGTLTETNHGNIATLANNTAYTVTSDPLTVWTAKETGTAITEANGGTTYSIIGPDNAGSITGGGVYTHISGNSFHAPEVIGNGTYVISIPGVTASSVISNVVFDFALGGTTNTSVFLAGTPEPGSLALAAVMGCGAIAGIRRRRKLTSSLS